MMRFMGGPWKKRWLFLRILQVREDKMMDLNCSKFIQVKLNNSQYCMLICLFIVLVYRLVNRSPEVLLQ